MRERNVKEQRRDTGLVLAVERVAVQPLDGPAVRHRVEIDLAVSLRDAELAQPVCTEVPSIQYAPLLQGCMNLKCVG